MFGQSNQNQQWQPQGPQPVTNPAPVEPTTAPVPAGFAPTTPATPFGTPPAAPTATPEPAATETIPEPPAAPTAPVQIAAHGTVSTDDLLQIKQDALQELSPLVGHLEQAPEEKFRTTMMMIQASDDHSLLQTAYDIAKQITDEKIRAQALLDVVNEINYFTQHHQPQA